MAVEAPSIIVDQEHILSVVQRALEGRKNKEGIFASEQEVIPPEKDFIELMQHWGKLKGSERYTSNALFFTTTTVYADNSTRQFKYMSDKFNYLRHGWIFDPDLVVRRKNSQVIRAANDLIRPGYNRQALERWQHNAQVLVDNYEGDVGCLFAKHNYNAPAILDTLMGPRRKEKWTGFHRFGPKLGRLFLQWAHQYKLAPLKNMEAIGVPVDWQVARIVIQTGGVAIDHPVNKHWILDKTLIPLFTSLCQENGFSSQEVSETLWLIGNRCCNDEKHDLCPLSSLCTRYISRDPLDRNGLFDPTDRGRYKVKVTN